MFEFKPFSVEVMEQGLATALLDYPNLDDAKKKAWALLKKKTDRMINVLVWDASMSHVLIELAMMKDGNTTPYDPSTTTH